MFHAQKINNGQFYFDLAYRSAQSATIVKKFKVDNIREKAKKVACYWICMFAKNTRGLMSSISAGFPVIKTLPEFYAELINAVINTRQMEYSLNAILWTAKKISEIESKHCSSIKREMTLQGIEKQKKAFLGRAGSLFKRLDKHLAFLEECRRKFRDFPNIKTGIPTICICGFPNVGKSTLLSKITTAKPEIAPYAFTTKSLMLGYIGKEMQIVDTPGTFKEMFNKMNWIEKQSYLAIKYLATAVVYVFDITETCGFLLKDQLELYEKMRKGFPEKGFIVYLSKNDIIKKEKLKQFAAEHGFPNVFYDENELKKTLLKKYKHIKKSK